MKPFRISRANRSPHAQILEPSCRGNDIGRIDGKFVSAVSARPRKAVTSHRTPKAIGHTFTMGIVNPRYRREAVVEEGEEAF